MPTTRVSDDMEWIELLDDKGRIRIRIDTSPMPTRFGTRPIDNPAVILYDERERSRVLVSIGDDGSPAVVFYDEYGRIQTSLGFYTESESEKLGYTR